VRIRIGDDSNPSAVLGPGEELLYRVKVTQVRRGEGVGRPVDRSVLLNAKLSQRTLGGGGVSIVIEDVDADGETTQVEAAERLRGKALTVLVGPDGIRNVSLGIAGDADVNAIDVALLFQLVSPVLPGAGGRIASSRSLTGITAPWSDAIALDVVHRNAGRHWARWVPADEIETEARGTIAFRLPIAREAAPSSGSRTPLVDEVFASLFGVAESGGPAGALAASIAAIPFAVAAPFLAIADALGNFFGGGSSTPRRATIPLSGPIELSATTSLGGSDRRELRTTGRGTMRLEGKLPALSGDASDLSERPLLLTADWVYSKELIKPWPFGALPPASLLLIGNVVALAVVLWRRRRSRVTAPAA
ncbi:MAG: hypothetical protein ACRDKS_11950, partial [Actinomycetota bacterium]